MLTRRATASVAACLLLGTTLAGPALAQRRPEEDRHLREEHYNQAIVALQRQYNQQVTGVEQAYNARRIDHRQLEGDLANLKRQYDEGVAEQQRILGR